MNWSETLENSELETLIPINTNGINIVNNKKEVMLEKLSTKIHMEESLKNRANQQ